MKTYYIYAHFTKDTNELFYIGVGTGRRAWKTAGRNIYWKRIVEKHSYTVHIILDGFTNRDDAVKEEVRLQQLNKPRACLQYGDNLNKIVSKETRTKHRNNKIGTKHSEETKAKMSKAHLGNVYCLGFSPTIETRAKISKSHLGKFYSEETKQNMSKAQKGKKRTEEHKQNMSKAQKGKKLSKETRKNISDAQPKRQVTNCRGEVFKSLIDAANAYGLDTPSHISSVCRGMRKSSGKYSDGTKIKWLYNKPMS